ncbi:MAG: tRNA-dihydrouridine synthase [Bacillota bacterium]|nr:tRNA-dihydrouridine synthase [Bacillota bacterium]
MHVDMSVKIGKLGLKNPVMLASGALSSNGKNILAAGERGYGAVVLKTATLEPCEGNPQPRWAFRDSFLVSADGLPNPGYKKMAELISLVKGKGLAIPVIGSIAGSTPEEYARMAEVLERGGADAIELNLVCPHRGKLVGGPEEEPMGEYWSRTPERAGSVIKTVKQAVKVPVWAKFPSERPVELHLLVQAMKEAGVDALVPFPGVIKGMVIDIETGKPVLGNIEGSGAVTGKAIKPMGIKTVSELCRRFNLPVIGTGGVSAGADVIEYMMAGACAVQVLTSAMKAKKEIVNNIKTEIMKYMQNKGLQNLESIKGLSLPYLPGRL